MPPFDGVPRPTRGVGFAKKLRGSGFHSVAIHGEQEDAELKVRDDTFCWEEGRWKDASFSFVAISQATACQKLVLKLERPLPSIQTLGLPNDPGARIQYGFAKCVEPGDGSAPQ